MSKRPAPVWREKGFARKREFIGFDVENRISMARGSSTSKNKDIVSPSTSRLDNGILQEDTIDVQSANDSEDVWNEALDETDYELPTISQFCYSSNVSSLCDTDRMRASVTEFLIKSRMSRSDSFELENILIEHGKPFPFRMKSIWNDFDEMKKKVEIEKRFVCRGCSEMLVDEFSPCTNARCETFSAIKKRGKTTGSNAICFLKILPQLIEILESKFDVIKHNHEVIHNVKKEGRRLSGENLLSEAYFKRMETLADFEKKRMILPLTINMDGAKYKTTSTKEYTPLIIRVDGLGKGSLFNNLLAAYHKGDSGVTAVDVDVFSKRLVDEILSINGNGITLPNGWCIKVCVLSYLTDIKAERILGDLPNWTTAYGCHLCYIKAEKCKHWYSFNKVDNLVRRTTKSCSEDAKLKIFGFEREKIPRFFIICTPNKYTIDSFHTIAEGIVKRAINEVFDKSWDWSKQKRGRLDALIDSMDKIIGYTHGIPIMSLNSRKQCTGSQLEATAIFALPLSAFGEIHSRNSYCFYILSICMLIWYSKNSSTFLILKKMMNLVGRLHILCENSRVTLKHHYAYVHLIDQWIMYGSSYDTRDFEKIHHVQQKLIHHKSTNNMEDVLARFLLKRSIELRTPQVPENQSSFLMNEVLLSEVEMNDIQHLELHGFDTSEVTFWKRASIYLKDREKSLVVGGNTWKTQTTTQNCVVVMKNGSPNFYLVNVFFEYNRGLFASGYKLITKSGEQLTNNLLTFMENESNNVKVLCVEIQKIFEQLKIPFHEILGQKKELFNIEQITSAAIVAGFERKKFVDDDYRPQFLEYGSGGADFDEYLRRQMMERVAYEQRMTDKNGYTQDSTSPNIRETPRTDRSAKPLFVDRKRQHETPPSPLAPSQYEHMNFPKIHPSKANEQSAGTSNNSRMEPVPKGYNNSGKFFVDFPEKFESCIVDGRLSLIKSGQTMLRLRETHSDQQLSEKMDMFIKSNPEITISKEITFSHPDLTYFQIGNQLATRLFEARIDNTISTKRKKDEAVYLDSVEPNSLSIKGVYQIPTDICDPFKKGHNLTLNGLCVPPHYYYPHQKVGWFLIELLQKVCEKPEHIVYFNYVVRKGSANSKYTPIIDETVELPDDVTEYVYEVQDHDLMQFPQDIYEKLKQLFVEYLDLDWQIITNPIENDENILSHPQFDRFKGNSDQEKLECILLKRASYKRFVEVTFTNRLQYALAELRACKITINTTTGKRHFERRNRHGKSIDKGSTPKRRKTTQDNKSTPK